MKKVAIFVEGQTEQIFIEKIIYQIFGYQKTKIIKTKIYGKNLFITLRSNISPDNIDYIFLIINVDTDERVLSAMLENAQGMQKKNFDKIIGLRDLFPKPREQKKVMLQTIQKIIESKGLTNFLKLILAVMEIEAWFLADSTVFEKISPQLTASYIRKQLGFDLENDDPEITYKHPSNVIKDIYKLAQLRYRKKADDIYKIVENIDYDILFFDAREQGKIDSFFLLLHEIDESTF